MAGPVTSSSSRTSINPLLHNLSLSNPASARVSPTVSFGMQPHYNASPYAANSLLSPPTMRRNLRSVPIPVSSYTSTGQPPDPYAGPSSLPNTSYTSAYRGNSMGPNIEYDQQQQGSSRRARLMRQHRSLESEFPPVDPYLQPGPSLDFPVYDPSRLPSSRPPVHQSHSSGGLVSNTAAPLSISTAHNYNIGSAPPSGPNSFGPYTSGANLQGSSHLPYDSYGAPYMSVFGRDPYTMSMPVLQREYESVRREYESAIQKLNSTMNSIKTFWSPELKRERAYRKEESGRLQQYTDQIKMVTQENQKQSGVIRQLQDELQNQYELQRTIRDTDLQSVPRDEYEAIRLEKERYQREMVVVRDNVRDLGMQIETQRQTLVARDDSIKKLLEMLQSKGMVPYNASAEHMELERCRGRLIELENRCRHLETTLHQKDQDVRSLQDECMNASEKLRQLQGQCDRLQRFPGAGPGEANAYQSLLDTKEARVEHLEKQLMMYEDEIGRLREERVSIPREFTDKTVTDREFQDMKLKFEKCDLELSSKANELSTLQARLSSMDEQGADIKKHLVVVKEANNAKEQQISLLQADIEALRCKLEVKNENIEQKQSQLSQLQQEKLRVMSESADNEEQMKIKDSKMAMQLRKIEGLEELVKEKEATVESLKQRLQTSPQQQQQRQIQDQLEEMSRDRDRLGHELREERERGEQERLEQLDAHRREVRDLRLAIESLQKEIGDRQVLIESQQEKIGDLSRDNSSLRSTMHASLAEKAEAPERFELERLNVDLDEARGEVEKLLDIVKKMEKEKDSLNTKMKDMQRQLDDSHRFKAHSSGLSLYSGSANDQWRGVKPSSGHSPRDGKTAAKDQRIEELEEALRESVSITAEREFAVAQQKQIAQQKEHMMNQYKEQLNNLQRQYEEMNSKLDTIGHNKHDKDALQYNLKKERRKHMEEVLQLKHESLVAAISEKDAHIALIEASHHKQPEQLNTLRRHKEKLMRKLKEEVTKNEKRVRLMNETSTGFDVGGPSLANDLRSSPPDQVIQAIRCVELEKKKLVVFIDQLVACVLDIDPQLLNGLPRTQQNQAIDNTLLSKLTHQQLLFELLSRQMDVCKLEEYTSHLLHRLSSVSPALVRKTMAIFDSLKDSHPASICLLQRSRISRSQSDLKSISEQEMRDLTDELYSSRRLPHSQSVSPLKDANGNKMIERKYARIGSYGGSLQNIKRRHRLKNNCNNYANQSISYSKISSM